jgi:hypothetical protein
MAGSDSLLVRTLLREIASQQQNHTEFFVQGSFRGSRIHASRPDLARDDNNIFFTALIGAGLKSIRPALKGDDLRLCDSILHAIPAAYVHYKNRSLRLTYNFWPTDHPQIFPGDPILSNLTKTNSLPDDADDTSVILASMDSLSDADQKAVKAMMAAHAAGVSKKIHNYYPAYKQNIVYSTWFGNRMPLDIDFSVECNVLYWIRTAGLPLTSVDSATVRLLVDIVQKRRLLNDPAYVSPHYARTPVLIYQISRLCGVGQGVTAPGSSLFQELDSLKPLLISQAWEDLSLTTSPMDSILLASSLIRLGVPPSRIPVITFRGVDQDDERFVFFIGTFSDYFPNPFRRLFLTTPLICYRFQCVAYNRFLLLEYLLLSQGREA